MDDFGIDFAQLNGDFLPGMSTTSGRRLLLDDLARRFETPEGFFGQLVEGEYPWDRLLTDYGYDLRQFLNAPVTNTTQIENRIAAECRKDERVLRAKATVTFSNEKLEVLIRIIDNEGPFEMTISVSELSVSAFFNE